MCHRNSARTLTSQAEEADSHSAVPSHREVAVLTAPGFCWLIRAHEPKAKSNIYRYSPPIADSALSAPGSIRSTDRVGPSSKPEKTTIDRPVPALHSAGSAPGSGICSYRHAVGQVVIPLDQLGPQPALAAALDHPQLQWCELPRASFQNGLWSARLAQSNAARSSP